MIWTIKEISEADFGCEERMPGEPLMDLVTIEAEDGRQEQFEVPDNWLTVNSLNEGDDWPEDIDETDCDEEKNNRMTAWMDNYFNAVDEMEEG